MADVNERVIHVFREPGASGYRVSFVVEPGKRLACAALPEAALEAAELFPPDGSSKPASARGGPAWIRTRDQGIMSPLL